MNKKVKKSIIKSKAGSPKNEIQAQILQEFKLATKRKNQLLAFLKPESFLEKTEEQIEKIVDLALEKFKEYKVSVDGVAVFPGPTLEKHSIMDRHYGVINFLSKNASKKLSKEDRELVLSTLGISDKNTKILGGHEAFDMSELTDTKKFDEMWLETPSTKIRSGFYVRSMVIKNETVVVVNGFHPHQLAHYTASGRQLVVMLVSSNTSWSILRDEMLGSTFPEKASPKSIRGIMHQKAKDYGFESVKIENNIMHLSAGPTEALFEMDNFFKEALGIDILEKQVKLAAQLQKSGLTKDQISKLMTDQEIHSELEHKDTKEAVKTIKKKFLSKSY